MTSQTELHLAKRKRTSSNPVVVVELPSPKLQRPIQSRNPSVDDYKFTKKIGEGAHGAVYLVKHIATGKAVAVKVQEIQDPVRSEVQFHSAAAQHPSIVSLKEVIISHGAVYMVMPYIRNTLRSVIDCSVKRICEDRVRQYMNQLLQSIAHIHSLGILHRDVNPSNLLVTSKGDTKLCDFGVACISGQAYYPAGTLPYCAPEMFLERDYTAAVDVWSAGCVFYELLFNEILFEAEAEDEIGLQKMIFHKLGKPNQREWPEFFEYQIVKDGILDLDGIREDTKGIRDLIPHSEISYNALDLLSRMLTPNPKNRITTLQALGHPWFEK